jgi:hypothetical protein
LEDAVAGVDTATVPAPGMVCRQQASEGAAMTFATPWLGRKRVAFVPLFRSRAAPPDQIPPDWENGILRRVVYDPRREANGADRSPRAHLRSGDHPAKMAETSSQPTVGAERA